MKINVIFNLLHFTDLPGSFFPKDDEAGFPKL